MPVRREVGYKYPVEVRPRTLPPNRQSGLMGEYHEDHTVERRDDHEEDASEHHVRRCTHCRGCRCCRCGRRACCLCRPHDRHPHSSARRTAASSDSSDRGNGDVPDYEHRRPRLRRSQVASLVNTTGSPGRSSGAAAEVIAKRARCETTAPPNGRRQRFLRPWRLARNADPRHRSEPIRASPMSRFRALRAAWEPSVYRATPSRTMAVRMFDATRHPTMRRENTSTMKHTYAMPERVGTYVGSATPTRRAGLRRVTYGYREPSTCTGCGVPLGLRRAFR